jgi:hypothetical protein
MAAQNGAVPIGEAAQRAGIDVAQIRRWADIDGLEIHRRGGTEVVLLERVMALSASARRRDRSASRGALRARLADARIESARVAELQQTANDRSGSGPS